MGLIAACCVTFYWQWHDASLSLEYAFVPRHLISRPLLHEPLHVLSTLVTSVFLHAGLFHIGTNMLFLWVFGDNVEDRLGKLRFALFYIACGVAGNLAQAIFKGFEPVRMLGASGAVAGVLGAYFISFRGARVYTFIFPWSLFTGLIPIPAGFFIGLWFIMQVFAGIGGFAPEVRNIAWFAHVGGFVAGIVLCKWMRPKPPSEPRGPRLRWIRER